MKQQRIDYSDIVDLGFTIEKADDQVYYNTYGFKYWIVYKRLSDVRTVYWNRETGFCELVTIDSLKTQNVIKREPIEHYHALVELIHSPLDELAKLLADLLEDQTMMDTEGSARRWIDENLYKLKEVVGRL